MPTKEPSKWAQHLWNKLVHEGVNDSMFMLDRAAEEVARAAYSQAAERFGEYCARRNELYESPGPEDRFVARVRARLEE